MPQLVKKVRKPPETIIDSKKIIFLIPPELNEIEISKIFLFLQSENSNSLSSYKKLISKFKTLGNISNKS
ncbi:MAG: hypothetical protein KAX28_01490, partial [Candidatus Marinimicrobia bacterium]|nr:hypothetical protein [Candidatus Neomarinimicrobiota bacterium]